MMDFTVRQMDIIQAAIKIIAREGYGEFTTKHLAQVVGVSEAALYRHFNSKTDLVHKILSYFEDLANKSMGSIQITLNDPLEQVKAFIMNRLQLFMDNPDLAKVMFSEELYQNDRSLAEHNLAIMHIHRDQLTRSIFAAQEQQKIRSELDAIQVFRIIVGSTRLLVTQWQLSGNAFPLIEEGKKLWSTLELLITPHNQDLPYYAGSIPRNLFKHIKE